MAKMNFIYKVIWLFIGCIASGMLYLVMRYSLSIFAWLGFGGASLGGVLFFIVIPISILAGGITTGYGMRNIDDKIAIYSIIYNPGLFFSLAYFALITNFPVLRSLDDHIIVDRLLLFLKYSVFYMVISAAGFYVGSRIRSGKGEKSLEL